MDKEITQELLTALDKEYGSYDSQDGRLYLTQHPWPSDAIGKEDFYCAYSIDSDGNQYQIFFRWRFRKRRKKKQK